MADWENQDEMFTLPNAFKSSDNKKGSGKEIALKRTFEQCGLLTREEEEIELGRPKVSRSGCFGCCYIGEQEAGATSYEEINSLMNTIRKCISKTDPISLTIHIANRYKCIQNDVNAHLQKNEQPLPDWDAASILEHIRHHNTDPELQGWHRMVELQELTQIALKASVVRDPDTGTVQIDEKQGKMYIEFVKAMESLSKSDPSKKLYYSGGNHLDLKAAAEGPISFSGKSIVSFLRQRK